MRVLSVSRALYLVALATLFCGTLSSAAQTVAIGKYRTKEPTEKAFLSNLRTIPLHEFTIKASDKEQGTIQAARIDKSGRHEFASLFVLVTKEGDGVLIEATFTRNAGFMGGGKPADWATEYGEGLKAVLPDLTIEVTKVEKK